MTHPSSFPRWRWPWLLSLLLLVVAAWQPLAAQTIPPRPNPPRLVNDLAGLLSADQVATLERKLVAYNDSTSSQMAVVTVPNLDGDDIADYAQQLYEKWGIGQKGKDNGILLLVAQQEHRARIQTGYGLEGAVPDALAKRIITNTIVPAFKQEHYYDGLDQATDELISLAKGEYQADQAPARTRDSSGSGFPFWLIILVFVIIWFLSRRGGGGRGGRRNRGFGGSMIPPILFGDFAGGRGTFGGGGGGGFGGGGGGGFGGFGGGSSGGGGASGSW